MALPHSLPCRLLPGQAPAFKPVHDPEQLLVPEASLYKLPAAPAPQVGWLLYAPPAPQRMLTALDSDA